MNPKSKDTGKELKKYLLGMENVEIRSLFTNRIHGDDSFAYVLGMLHRIKVIPFYCNPTAYYFTLSGAIAYLRVYCFDIWF